MKAESQTGSIEKPLLVVTGALGNLGKSVVKLFSEDFTVVGLDQEGTHADVEVIATDLTSEQSVALAFDKIANEYGKTLSVIHLVAYFDWSGEPSPLYEKVNVEGTKHLLKSLQDFQVERFIYASTMLVHKPCLPGERIDESSPYGPRWEYPKSKKRAEDTIRRHHGDIPYTILRLAGVYDTETMVPTLSQQIARIYERQLESHLYSGKLTSGQSMLHREDMLDAVYRAVKRREQLPQESEILIGEPFALSYDNLQNQIGEEIHGKKDWLTLRLPKPVAAVGAKAQEVLEPAIPDAIDKGEPPFVKPFMVNMADDHYALDVAKAERELGWRPQHRLQDELPAMIAELKSDPKHWYENNNIAPPQWLDETVKEGHHIEALREDEESRRHQKHRQNRWAHFLNIALGFWLVTQPWIIGTPEPFLRWSEFGLGVMVIIFASLSLSWKMGWARIVTAGLGALIMAAPFVFWTQSAAVYLSDTLIGALVFGFAIATQPEVGPKTTARMSGPELPMGWSFNPSSWCQRIPIIFLALIGLLISRYLTGYQLGHIDGVWEPFFEGATSDPQNGTEEIITSSVSEAWPVPDAALGAYTYALEILTGIVGTRARWRTMPWLVMLFGLMIVPLGIVSISFIIIQPILIGTWSTLALMGAAAMLIQIPYSLDELVATGQFLRRRKRAGASLIGVLLFGDTDKGTGSSPVKDEFDRRPDAVLKDMWSGGVNLPWTLLLVGAIGVLLMFSRLTFDSAGTLAHIEHLIGALVLTVLAIAAAEVTRVARFALIPLGAGLIISTLALQTLGAHLFVNFAIGGAIIALSFNKGKITSKYGKWDRFIN
ncbi:vitamin K epoxide reductase family protein [Litorimonas haliclonae]|uniref:vitamin K epoxide reductase family protein n=1 Tax=Litorimonas haliclonae TaxID=2081977 RepID=UPI0039EE873B